jgi:RNA polymerase sigma-70 factor (ECF subfamily)
MQETAALLWKNFSQFEPGTNFVSWAVTIAKFQILNYRKRHKQSRTFLSDKAYDLLIPETEKLQEESQERLQALRECLKKLSGKDQQFIRMRYYEGASARIVAQKVGTSIDAVYRYGARLNHLLLSCVRRAVTYRA